jgi:hypothetical protein
MANGAREAGLPPELPIMAALVASGLQNLPFGDADAVGFFQMRVGIWNQGPYAGFPDHLMIPMFLADADYLVPRKLLRERAARLRMHPAETGVSAPP